MLIWQIITLIMLLILSGFFSGVEIALVSVSKLKVRHFLKQKKKGAEALSKLKNKPRRMIITILIGNNVVNISASVLATIIATDLFGSKGIGIAVGVMTLLILIFGEIIPKAYASTYFESVSLKVSKPLLIFQKILFPIVIVLEWLTNKTLRLFGKTSGKKFVLTEEELKTAFDITAEQNVIEKQEKKLLTNVLKFNDITAKEVMTRRKKVFALNANMTVKEVLAFVAQCPYSRIPLYLGSLDKIIAVIHFKDILEAIHNKDYDARLRDIGVKPLFINENVIIDDLFKIFQERHTHMAVVINKKKRITGIVTIEDLIEEIVGEIIDEFDVTPSKLMRIDKNTILVDGETPPNYINSFFQMSIPEKFATLSDYLIHKYKQLPPRGKELKIGKHLFFIEEIGEEFIERVRIKKLK
ncbi:MAG: CNNM domain-containing protein [Nanoarchaeota archaeon]|nr:DUF21 domain-containing protein [Nanoarchaeota archaeon]MBU1031038.1 DUF21 domain-containing protein [Nanoarchaeota archaeon]MBU1849634.1 DUF21 domain-containing protein [Nanoarchaeota archaeon]